MEGWEEGKMGGIGKDEWNREGGGMGGRGKG